MNSLNRLNEDWPLVEHRSRVPHAALWRELLRYSGRDLAEHIFTKAPADPDFIIPFKNAISTADDMIAGWEDVEDEFTGAILLYYGTLWFGNAVALCTLNSSILNQRAALHGLGIGALPDGRRKFLNTRVAFGKDEESLAIINLAFGGSSVSGQTVTVQDLLRLLPEMGPSLEHVGLKSTAIEVAVHPWSGELEIYSDSNPTVTLQLIVDSAVTMEWLRDNVAIYPYLKAKNVKSVPGYEQVLTWQRWSENGGPSGRTDAAELRALCIDVAGRWYLLRKLNKLAISEYAIYLTVLYVIGRLARYYPDYWIEMQRDRLEDFFLIQEFLDLAEDKVPSLVLNHLSQKTHLFKSS